MACDKLKVEIPFVCFVLLYFTCDCYDDRDAKPWQKTKHWWPLFLYSALRWPEPKTFFILNEV